MYSATNNNRVNWFALYVKSRQERLVSERLRDMGYEEFVPFRKTRRKWSDRTKVVEEPLFPGYVFCNFDAGNRLPILQTPGVVVIIGNGRDLAPVAEHEIESLRTVVNSGCVIQDAAWIKAGESVEITEGPLMGVRGVLLRNKGVDRLVVSVALLERAVSVEVDRTAVRPIRRPANSVGSLAVTAA